MEKIKYLVYELEGVVNSIMFPAYIEHKRMADNVSAVKVVGAGFCYHVNNNGKLEIVCHGYSHSLDIKSRGISDSIKLSADFLGFCHHI